MGAPQGNTNALTHGGSTAAVRVFKQEIKQAIQRSKALLNEARNPY